MKGILLNVTGMSCEHCVASVRGALAELPGVKDIQIDLPAGEVRVQAEDGGAGPDRMKEAIEALGFDVVDAPAVPRNERWGD